jgi:hypothetical protein
MDGASLRDAGLARALTATPDSWRNAYLRGVADWFADLPRGAVFNGEMLRLQVEDDIGQPHHANVWGAAAAGYIRPLLKLGLVEHVGLSQAISPQAHARSYPTYRKL